MKIGVVKESPVPPPFLIKSITITLEGDEVKTFAMLLGDSARLALYVEGHPVTQQVKVDRQKLEALLFAFYNKIYYQNGF